MITREQAIEAAVDYLTCGLRRRLQVFEGWPGEAQRRESSGPPAPTGYRAVPTDSPDLVEIRASQDELPDLPSSESPPAIRGFPRRVWSIRIPDDGGHVGSSDYLVVDAETGRVFTRMPWGE